MQLDEFLYNLHFDVDQVRPATWAVDWEDAPPPFKLYQDLPATMLSSDLPITLKSVRSQTKQGVELREVGLREVELKEIGDFFWYSYGLTQLCQIMMPPGEEEERASAMQMLRRYVPSGGGLYPSELYAYLKVEGLCPGIYHYDVAHHRLILLREGNFDEYLERALGHRGQLGSCFGTLFVSTMFWKNFFKYHNFSYRLQGLDAGALIGQLLEVAKQFGYASSVYFQFLDRAINHLLGVNEREESVYAVIPLKLTAGTITTNRASVHATQGIESAETLCKELVTLQHKHYDKSSKSAEYPMLVRMNEASMFHSTSAFTQFPASSSHASCMGGDITLLPNIQRQDYDFSTACRQRFSPALDFVFTSMSLEDLAALCRETTLSFAYDNDLDSCQQEWAPRVSLAACVHGVEGIADGAYLYESKLHGLQLLRGGDHRLQLQQAMSMPTVNLAQVPLCLHLVGSRGLYQQTFGKRGYRIQQMEVGMFLQRLLLRVSARGMGGHPLLGYDEGECDQIYNFERQGKTCLIQVPVGFYRKTSRFEGALHG